MKIGIITVHIVGVQRRAALEAERLEHQREVRGGRGDHAFDRRGQLRGADVAGINHMGAAAQAVSLDRKSVV